MHRSPEKSAALVNIARVVHGECHCIVLLEHGTGTLGMLLDAVAVVGVDHFHLLAAQAKHTVIVTPHAVFVVALSVGTLGVGHQRFHHRCEEILCFGI